MPSIYLLHFNPAYKQAKHYLGYADRSVANRVGRHRRGRGARLTQVAVENGVELQLARVWTGDEVDRHFERHLKNGKNAPKLCPICAGGAEPLDADSFK